MTDRLPPKLADVVTLLFVTADGPLADRVKDAVHQALAPFKDTGASLLLVHERILPIEAADRIMEVKFRMAEAAARGIPITSHDPQVAQHIEGVLKELVDGE